MPRKRPTFSQTDLTRALKATKAAGLKVGRIELTDDRIVIHSASDAPAGPDSTYDTWKAKRDARSA
ncbi:hypothetical protein OICFNHDK_4430 [Methylobacterium bullatum]|uniref:Uncharacterized protein n=1 Tax=Methylobacterium bullatum TaxID=570505 RepID=A0AAV4ZCS1_9HYPH|nr:hypothetical protein [Methylobacterium bullatum]GJD41944.1 hypothetical protein OICFNHDK_4430 [Methylobacterium bullatum]